MHNTERLHVPIIQCLANDNSPMFIDPYNTGTVLHGHCGLLSTVLTVLWYTVRVLYCKALQSTVRPTVRYNIMRDAGAV